MGHEMAFLAIFYDDVMLDARSANSNPEGSAAGYAHARRSHGHAFALTIGGGRSCGPRTFWHGYKAERLARVSRQLRTQSLNTSQRYLLTILALGVFRLPELRANVLNCGPP